MNLSRTAVILGIVGLSISFSAVTVAEEKGLSPLEQCYQSVGDAPRTKIAGCLGAKLKAADTRLNTILAQQNRKLHHSIQPEVKSYSVTEFVTFRLYYFPRC